MSSIISKLINLAGNITGTLGVGNGGTGTTTSTGSGSVVLSTSPVLVTPALGVPASGTLTNCTGYPAATSTTAGTVTVQGTGTVSTTFTFNGSGGTSGSITIKYTRVGGVVTGYIPFVLATSGTASTQFISNTAISDTWARPTTQQFMYAVSTNNNTNQSGLLAINTDGTFTLSRDATGATWQNSTNNCGLGENTIFSYYVA
jgi:hypothetical protein